MTAHRFLLISLSNIGDAVMTTPVLQALHAYDPGAVIDIVADRRSSAIFAGCPFLGRILHKDKALVMRGLLGLLTELRDVEYDLVVDLRTDILPLLVRARRRLFRWQGRPAGPHAVQQHLGVIARLALDIKSFDTKLWLGSAENDFARNVLAEHLGRRLLALAPGANWPPKIWPAKQFMELIELMRGDFDAVVLLGSEADKIHTSVIAAQSALPCVDLAGQTGLLEAAAILRHTKIFVGNDSGLGHIASAVQIPTLTLFGVGDPDRYHPWGPKASWILEPNRDLSRLLATDVVQVLRKQMGKFGEK